MHTRHTENHPMGSSELVEAEDLFYQGDEVLLKWVISVTSSLTEVTTQVWGEGGSS